MTMLKKLRPYPLRHEWVFWHDRSVEQTLQNGGSWSSELLMGCVRIQEQSECDGAGLGRSAEGNCADKYCTGN